MSKTDVEVQKLYNNIENIADNILKTKVNLKKCPKTRLTRSYIEVRLKCLEDHWSKYKKTYDDILSSTSKEDREVAPYFKEDKFYDHEELYIVLKSSLMDMLPVPEINATLPVLSEHKESRVVLPKIQLPTYSGLYDEWLSFHDLFVTLVHNNGGLNNVEKLHYLKTSLTGEAAAVLRPIKVADCNYQRAWDTLRERYGNKRINFNAIMKKFFSQKKLALNNANSIKGLLDTTFQCLDDLNNMNVNTENWDPMIIFIIVQKLDSETHLDWEQHVSSHCTDPDSLPSLDLLRQFMKDRYQTLELTESTKPRSSAGHLREKSFHLATNIENKKVCQICSEDHTLSHCKEFSKLSPVQRSEFVKTNNLCYNCLAFGHSVRQCRNPICCQLCKKRHHSLLHENKENNVSSNRSTEILENTETKQSEVAMHTNLEEIKEDITMIASHAYTNQSTALLATAIVQVFSEDNYTTTLRALIDQGSQASFISERAVQQIKAKRYPIRGTVIGVGSTKEDIKQVVQLKIKSRCEPFNLKVRTYVMSKQLTNEIPSRTINTNSWPHLNGLVLADPSYCEPGSIDLLLGVDVYAQIVQNELIKGPPGSPCAHKTNLGWILFGQVDCRLNQPESVLVMHHQIIADDFLKTLWEIEPDMKRIYTKEEEQCDAHYEKNCRRDNTGKYVVRLPFRTNHPVSPDGNTREIAMKRLTHHDKRMQRTPELREEYDKVLEEYLVMGHMEVVPEAELGNRSVYLPHHGVIRTDKETTKVRVVFDASCKGTNGISLNDELLIGPILQEDMRSIIMRWRMHRVCFVSDIMKMYRMILLDENDTDYHRLLWRRPLQDKDNCPIDVKDYRLKRVTFGTASAPYLAIKTLLKLADDEGKQYPEASKIIREDFYVDDLISGCDTTEEAVCVAKEITLILQQGGFELQKWASNNTEFLKSIDANKVTSKLDLDLKLDSTIKALGLSWNVREDEFHYQLQLEPVSLNTTKRSILSDLHRLFDPLGWIAPVIVTAKILVQKLWLEGVGWDQEIRVELNNEWKFIRGDLENVNKIKIKRWLNTFSYERDLVTLHGFCDASVKAYAAVVYCRIQKNREVTTHLVAARTKVAPVKTISLPRLELCGAVLLAKLLYKVSRAMRISIVNSFAWTDSTIVLSWLSGEPNRWKPFVANRVVEILEHISTTQWYHVQSSYNPADIASRGSSISELIHRRIWWEGPNWLKNEHIDCTRPTIVSTEEEKRKTIQSHRTTITELERKHYNKFEEYRSLTELLQVITHCKRFLNLKRNPQTLRSEITTQEMQNALDICIRTVQEVDYSDELNRLKQNKTVRTTSTLKTLNPFVDRHNILRVGGRLRNADVEENVKHPIILSKNNDLTPLILADAHEKTMHGGINMMITYLMTKYWIFGCKNLVKQFIHRCLTCARQRATFRQQMMGDLPEQRVTPSRPFSRSGVDFAGPVYVLNSKGKGAKKSKAYICIFVCMAVKAIHLELVSDLTSEAFIAAFKRFVARRGRCSEIWSDNGTTFVAANKELSLAWKEAGLEIPGNRHVKDILVRDGTQWHFTPPYSPNFGGLWEAGVKSVKQHLRKILTTNLTFEEFATVLTQIEACLNSRPLTPVPTDVDLIDDIKVLTPGHFLVGEALISIPDRDYTTANGNLLSRWQHTQRLVQAFWKRWQTEYLSRLNQRPKWLKPTVEFKVGDVVLLRNENMPPSSWALARVVEKHPGNDNITRVYTLRYKGKLVRRSTSYLCALPIPTKD